MKRLLALFSVLLTTIAMMAQPHWTQPSANAYPASTIVTAKVVLNGNEQYPLGDLELAAFVGEELRGVAYNSVAAVMPYMNLNVNGNDSDKGKTITFKAYCNGVEYNLPNELTWDGEHQGTESNPEKFYLYDFANCEWDLNGPIYLDRSSAATSSADLTDYIKVKFMQGADVVSTKDFKDITALPSDLQFNWNNWEGDPYAISGNTITATRPGSRGGNYLSGSVSYNALTPEGVVNVGHSLYCDVYITPYDKMSGEVGLIVSDITITKDTENYDIRQHLTFRFYDDTPGADGAPSNERTYTDVPFAGLTEFLGYEPNLYISISENSDDAYNGEPHFFAGQIRYLITARRPTSPEGVGVTVWGNGNDAKFNGEGRLYVTPFERFDGSVSMTINPITINKGEQIDIRDHITFTFPKIGDVAPGADRYEDVLYKDLPDYLGYTPEFTFEWYSQDNGYYTVGDDKYTVTGVKQTSRRGTDGSLMLKYGDHNYAERFVVYVTPYELLNMEDVSIELAPITVKKGASVDARDYITFTFRKYEETGAPSNFPDVVKYKDLAEYLGYTPEFTFRWNAVPADHYYSVSGHTVNGVKQTYADGANAVLALIYNSDPDVMYRASTRVYVTPFEVMGLKTMMHFDPSTIEVAAGQTIDLGEYITFDLPDAPNDGNGIATVKLCDFKERFGYVPAFEVIDASTSEYYTITYSNTSNGLSVQLKGNKRSPEDGVQIKFGLQYDLGYYDMGSRVVWSNTAEGLVKVASDHILLRSFELAEPNAVLHRFETKSIKLIITPDNAQCDINGFQVNDWSNITGNYGNNWKAADASIVKKSDGYYLVITPYLSGTLFYGIDYKEEDTEYTNVEGQYQVAAEQTINQGWGWYTFYGIAESTSINEFSNSYFNGNILDMRTQMTDTYKDPTYGYFGNLTDVEGGICYKMKTVGSVPETAYIVGEDLGAPGFTSMTEYMIYPHWNWFAYPYQYDRTIVELNDDLGVFGGVDGDRIISFADGFAEFDGSRGKWVGDLTTLRAGQGYLYYYNEPLDASAISNYFPPEGTLDQPAAPSRHRAPRQSQWQYDANQWSDNMSIVARIEGDMAEGLSLGAFVGDECRGEGRMVQTDDETYFFISVHGKSGEKISFRLTDGEKTYDVSENVRFETCLGSLKQPAVLHAFETTGISSVEANAQAAEKMYDLSGRRVRSAASGIRVAGGKTVLR